MWAACESADKRMISWEQLGDKHLNKLIVKLQRTGESNHNLSLLEVNKYFKLLKEQGIEYYVKNGLITDSFYFIKAE